MCAQHANYKCHPTVGNLGNVQSVLQETEVLKAIDSRNGCHVVRIQIEATLGTGMHSSLTLKKFTHTVGHRSEALVHADTGGVHFAECEEQGVCQCGVGDVSVGRGQNAVHDDVTMQGVRVVKSTGPFCSNFGDGRLKSIAQGEQIANLDGACGLELTVNVEVVT